MGKYGQHRPLVGLTLGLWLWAAPGLAECRLALLLALDVSSSVDAIEDRLQRQGLAAALASDEVQAALFSVPGQSVALAVYEWSGRNQQAVLLRWRLLETPGAVAAAAGEIARSQRRFTEFPTALGYAVGYAASLFRSAPPCLARTLDVSGDGVSNDGFLPYQAYREFPLGGVVVNGLTIGGQREALAAYYRRELIKGPGAFVEQARDFSDFERAMTAKLVRELRALAVGALPGAGRDG